MCLFRVTGDVFYRGDNLGVRPGGGEFGLARPSDAVPVPTAGGSGTIAVQDVPATLGDEANAVQLWPVRMVARFEGMPSRARRKFPLPAGLRVRVWPLVSNPDELGTFVVSRRRMQLGQSAHTPLQFIAWRRRAVSWIVLPFNPF